MEKFVFFCMCKEQSTASKTFLSKTHKKTHSQEFFSAAVSTICLHNHEYCNKVKKDDFFKNSDKASQSVFHSVLSKLDACFSVLRKKKSTANFWAIVICTSGCLGKKCQCNINIVQPTIRAQSCSIHRSQKAYIVPFLFQNFHSHPKVPF